MFEDGTQFIPVITDLIHQIEELKFNETSLNRDIEKLKKEKEEFMDEYDKLYDLYRKLEPCFVCHILKSFGIKP